MIEGYLMSFKLDRHRFGGGIILCIWENVPSKQ